MSEYGSWFSVPQPSSSSVFLVTATVAAYSGAVVLPPVSTVLTAVPIVPYVKESLGVSAPRYSVPEEVVLEPQGGEDDPPLEDEAVIGS